MCYTELEVLITGSAGFIGFHLTNRLLGSGFNVVGLDNHNVYYDISLRETIYWIFN